MKLSSTTQQKFTCVKLKALCDPRLRLSTGELSFKQGQSSAGLIYDLALLRTQIHEFKSIAVARAAAQDSSNPERAARNGH